MLDVCLLGTGGMMPLPNRWLTSLMTRYNGKGLLIDCGEGTQIALKESGWSCHDIDILQWLIGKKCVKVQSFGSLSYFKRENAPKESPEYCIDGCPKAEKCPYNAVKIYLDDKENELKIFPKSVSDFHIGKPWTVV